MGPRNIRPATQIGPGCRVLQPLDSALRTQARPTVAFEQAPPLSQGGRGRGEVQFASEARHTSAVAVPIRNTGSFAACRDTTLPSGSVNQALRT